MHVDHSRFDALIARAQHALIALDGLTQRDGSKATAAAMNLGNSVQSELLDYQRTVWMTKEESALLANALDLVRARLKFFGERA
jgi:hypothetical protein